MTKKRKSTSTFVSNPKRTRTDADSLNEDDNELLANGVQPRLDPTYGQRGAFPGLDGDGGDKELFFGPAEDGLEYLRMVRSEAKTVPNLLVAPQSPAPNEWNVDRAEDSAYKGYYEDGAYTAAPFRSTAPTHDIDDEDPRDDDQDPQEAYYTSLHTSFLTLRSQLHSPPPSFPGITSQPLSQASTHAKWRYSLLHTQATMAQLGSMRQETVMRGLRVLESVLTVKNLRKEGVGAWAWGLLARCRERGEMGSEDVGVLRDVGKRAGWVLRGLRGGRREVVEEEREDQDADVEVERREQDVRREIPVEDVEEGGGDGHDDGQLYESGNPKKKPSTTDLMEPRLESHGALARAKQSLLSALQPLPSPSPTMIEDLSPPLGPSESFPSKQKDEINHHIHISEDDPASTLLTHPQPVEKSELDLYATLDMIITIVGEFYGQRDLLEGRDLWDEVYEGG